MAKRRKSKQESHARPMIGWREWVALPDLGIDWVKAKIDTGARSSALHAYDVETFTRGGQDWVRFNVHPMQRRTEATVACEAELIDERLVRSSGGHETLRPVIVTTVELMGERHEIELTLTNRDAMGFRMLLGRQALRGAYVINPGRSFLGGHGPKRKKVKTRATERSDKRVASKRKEEA